MNSESLTLGLQSAACLLTSSPMSPPRCSRTGLPPALSWAHTCPWGLCIADSSAQKVPLSHPRMPGSFWLTRSWLSCLLLCEASAQQSFQNGLPHLPNPSLSPHPDVFLQSTLLSDILSSFIGILVCCLLSPLRKKVWLLQEAVCFVPCSTTIAKMPPDT